MLIQADQATLGTSASPIHPAVGQASQVLLVNTGSTTVYIGPAGVRAPYGFPLTAGMDLSLNLDPEDVVYGAVASGTGTVGYLHGNQ